MKPTTLLRNNKKLKPRYRALLHSPSGTGKLLTVLLLVKSTARDIYLIGISVVVSKYIGETEKNLANFFSKADNKDRVLFFDEADAHPGKRTRLRDAHDQYANQEGTYHLQRLEHYNSLVILATNIESNIDHAFTRRFQFMIYFPMPGAGERLLFWRRGLWGIVRRAEDVDLPALARIEELASAATSNILATIRDY